MVLVLALMGGACQPEAGDEAPATAAVPADQEEGVPKQEYDGVGVVVSFMAQKSFVNINHETIPGFMDAMTMPFPLPDSTLVEGIQIGDSISFRITSAGIIQAVEKIE